MKDGGLAGMAKRRGEERGVVEEGGAAGLTPRAQPGWGSSRGWSDAVIGVGLVASGRTRLTGAGSDANVGASDAKQMQVSELRLDVGLGPNVRALVLP